MSMNLKHKAYIRGKIGYVFDKYHKMKTKIIMHEKSIFKDKLVEKINEGLKINAEIDKIMDDLNNAQRK